MNTFEPIYIVVYSLIVYENGYSSIIVNFNCKIKSIKYKSNQVQENRK